MAGKSDGPLLHDLVTVGSIVGCHLMQVSLLLDETIIERIQHEEVKLILTMLRGRVDFLDEAHLLELAFKILQTHGRYFSLKVTNWTLLVDIFFTDQPWLLDYFSRPLMVNDVQSVPLQRAALPMSDVTEKVLPVLVTVAGGVNRCIKISDSDNITHDFCLVAHFNLRKSRIHLVENYDEIDIISSLEGLTLKTSYLASWPRTRVSLSPGLYFFKYQPPPRGMKRARSII